MREDFIEHKTRVYRVEWEGDYVDNSFDHEFGTETCIDFELSHIETWLIRNNQERLVFLTWDDISAIQDTLQNIVDNEADKWAVDKGLDAIELRDSIKCGW